jgi:branched-subunit amino acid aminotransferase/4-amino-4-deoxychorismate lyase
MARIWLNGTLVVPEHATISVLDRGLLSGHGLFETLRAYDGEPWAIADHYARLVQGAAWIDLELPDEERVASALRATVRANGLSDAGVRVTITAGAGPVDAQSEADGPPTMFVLAWPLRDYAALHADGAVIVTFAHGARALAHVKSTSYAMSVAGRVFAKRAGADDAIFTSDDGRVLEATGSNVFAAWRDRLVTPPLDEGILPGVTRRHVIEEAREIGFDVDEAPLRVGDLAAADEVVLTSSLREVYPARSIDGVAMGRAGVAERLREAFRQRVLSASKG